MKRWRGLLMINGGVISLDRLSDGLVTYSKDVLKMNMNKINLFICLSIIALYLPISS